MLAENLISTSVFSLFQLQLCVCKARKLLDDQQSKFNTYWKNKDGYYF